VNTPSFQDLEILILIPVAEATGYTTFPLRGSFHVNPRWAKRACDDFFINLLGKTGYSFF